MRRPIQTLIALVLAASALSLQPVAAEDTVNSLKEKAEADLKVEVEKLKMKYLIALEKLQKSLAEEGKLDAAVATKKEIERANATEVSLFARGTAGGGSSAPQAEGTITLTAKDASLGNGTQYDSKRKLINDWSRYGAFASWKLSGIQPGTYKVTLHYYSGNLGGGVLSIRSSSASDRFSIAGAGKWDELRQYHVGKVRLNKDDHLTLAALQGRSREMIYVDSLVLEPVE